MSPVARSRRLTSSTCVIGSTRPDGITRRPAPSFPPKSSRGLGRSTSRPMSAWPANRSPPGSSAEVPRPDPPEGGDPGPPGPGRRARAARARLRRRLARSRRAPDRAGCGLRRPGRQDPGRADVRAALGEPSYRELRGPARAGGGGLMARVGVVVFPGSCDEADALGAVNRTPGLAAEYLWHGDADLKGVDAVVIPGGFSYGDYLRPGAIARFSPVMDAVAAFAREGGPVLGICNGFQVLCEAGLLPGALLPNAGLRFVCRQVPLTVERADTQ